MIVQFELFGYFRAMAGERNKVLELPKISGIRLSEALHLLDEDFRKKGFSMIKDGELKTGILVFQRSEGGKTTRLDPEDEITGEAPVIILSNLMEGG
ncbi:MAG: MoaD/ThiS family protein [Spirochaetales bacterium]|nr:MoaD/ThiS family protein [Spirochaetales bacterium]